MNGSVSVVGAVAILALAFLAAPTVSAQGCSGATACVLITFPDDTDKEPDPKPNELWVKRDIRETIGTVRFIVTGKRSNGIVDFGSRTPFVIPEGQPNAGQPISKIDVTRPWTEATINRWLEKCDYECALNDEGCIKKKCSYKYTVKDPQGEYPDLDPVIIIDPK